VSRQADRAASAGEAALIGLADLPLPPWPAGSSLPAPPRLTSDDPGLVTGLLVAALPSIGLWGVIVAAGRALLG
jgi:hypothetical protein